MLLIYRIMKKTIPTYLSQSRVFLLLVVVVFNAFVLGANSLPITFEDEASYAWQDFGGAVATVVANPNVSGVNTSAQVTKMIKSGGESWAGSYLTLSSKIDFSTYKVFKVKVYTPAVGTKVLLKLENTVDNTQVKEVEAISTKANQWEELTFDFSGVDVSISFQKVVVFFDLGTVGDGTVNSTYYLDDISQPNVAYDGDDNDDTEDTDSVDLADYSLVWADEFEVDGALDDSKWFHQTQLPDGHGWFNGEVQHYTDRTANSYVEDGVMKLVAKKESFTDQGVNKQYTSARLNSKFAFTYGRVEVKAKLPTGVGTWPAIWMLGKNINEAGAYWDEQGHGTTNWPACGEIDIMEHWGSNQNVVSSAMHTPSSYGGTVNKGEQHVSTVSTDFHVYAMDWSADKIVFSVDDVVHYTYNPSDKNSETWPYDADQYLLFNIAIQGSISPSFTESSMDIDYVRVYQRVPLSSNIEQNSSLQLSVYPNPAQDVLNVTADESISNLTIYNSRGQVMLSHRSPGINARVDISSLEAGFYILVVQSETNTERVTFIKK